MIGERGDKKSLRTDKVIKEREDQMIKNRKWDKMIEKRRRENN